MDTGWVEMQSNGRGNQEMYVISNPEVVDSKIQIRINSTNPRFNNKGV